MKKSLRIGCLVSVSVVALVIFFVRLKLDRTNTQLRMARWLALACQSDHSVPWFVEGPVPLAFRGLYNDVGPPTLEICTNEAIAHWGGGLVSQFGYELKLDTAASTASTNIWHLFGLGQHGSDKNPLVTVALAKTEHLSKEDIALFASGSEDEEEPKPQDL